MTPIIRWPKSLKLAMSEPDGLVHILDSRGQCLCGRTRRLKRIRTTAIPADAAQCVTCRMRAGLPLIGARTLVDRLVKGAA